LLALTILIADVDVATIELLSESELMRVSTTSPEEYYEGGYYNG